MHLNHTQLEKIAEIRNAVLCAKGSMRKYKKSIIDEQQVIIKLYNQLLRIDEAVKKFE